MCEKQIVVPNSSILYCSERYTFSPGFQANFSRLHISNVTQLPSPRRRQSPHYTPIPMPPKQSHRHVSPNPQRRPRRPNEPQTTNLRPPSPAHPPHRPRRSNTRQIPRREIRSRPHRVETRRSESRFRAIPIKIRRMEAQDIPSPQQRGNLIPQPVPPLQ